MTMTAGLRRREYRDPPPSPPGRTPRRLADLVRAGLLLAWAGLLLAHLRGPSDPETAVSALATAAAAAVWLRVVLVREERLVWALFATGATGYAAGWWVLFEVSMGEGGGPGGLNYSDCLSLLLYPTWHLATLLRARARLAGWSTRALLDGAVVGMAVAGTAIAVSAELLPDAFSDTWQTAIYAAAYPIGSAVLLATALTVLVVVRFHADASSGLLVVGFGMLLVGQSLFAHAAARGTFAFGTWLDAVYLGGVLCIALAAWTRPGAPRTEAASADLAMVLTAASTLLAVAVLVLRTALTPFVAVALVAAAVVAAVLRTALYIRQDQLLAVRTTEALTDALTGLPNRRALIAELEDGEAASTRTLLLLDLDRFKAVNDSLGHVAGDQLLTEVGARLAAATPQGGTAARLGGDEFALVLPVPMADAWTVARSVHAALERPVLLMGHSLVLGASIGLTEVPSTHAGDCSELLHRADVALYKAKQAESSIEVWTPGLEDAARDVVLLLTDLRAALRTGDGLLVHLQPKCDPLDGRVRAVEALVRWQHAERGLLLPGAFLPAAESAGLLPQLTQLVLDLALADVAALRAAGYDLPVAVNVGADDLLDPRFASRVAAALDRHGLPAANLRLEVTENVVLRDPERVVRTLRLLGAVGIGLSLDDYGTGLASLTYLRELPIDELKIDRSFITPYLSDPTSRLITDSTLDLAHDLGLTVVAEGIEDAATGAALARAGCDLLQGWACGRPATREALLRELRASAPLAEAPLRA